LAEPCKQTLTANHSSEAALLLPALVLLVTAEAPPLACRRIADYERQNSRSPAKPAIRVASMM
jgi:hypothetical protein